MAYPFRHCERAALPLKRCHAVRMGGRFWHGAHISDDSADGICARGRFRKVKSVSLRQGPERAASGPEGWHRGEAVGGYGTGRPARRRAVHTLAVWAA